VITPKKACGPLTTRPSSSLTAKYNFHPRKAWLDHIRLSSVRLNDGGSGSFISSDGLLLTNHHVARGQLQKKLHRRPRLCARRLLCAHARAEMKSPISK